jgi:hypothetical protein
VGLGALNAVSDGSAQAAPTQVVRSGDFSIIRLTSFVTFSTYIAPPASTCSAVAQFAIAP